LHERVVAPAQLRAGACDVVEDPALDAREARPLWSTDSTELVHVRPAGDDDAGALRDFSPWRIHGRKRVTHAGSQLVITVERGPHLLRASISTSLAAGASYGFAVPLDTRLRMRLSEYQAHAHAIQGEDPGPSSSRQADRGRRLHLSALQALDAWQDGASQRDIAAALLGADNVVDGWATDSEVRAYVRHTLKRAKGLMNGGYLELAGIRRKHIATQGDELVH
jgi:hypothetical protein